jgi:hypothetical protein
MAKDAGCYLPYLAHKNPITTTTIIMNTNMYSPKLNKFAKLFMG